MSHTVKLPVDDAGEVEVLDAAQHLVEEVGHALMVQVHVDHLAQVRVHELHHDVEVEEVLQRLLGRERVQEANNLRVQNNGLIQFTQVGMLICVDTHVFVIH